jgi:hypothetical protein
MIEQGLSAALQDGYGPRFLLAAHGAARKLLLRHRVARYARCLISFAEEMGKRTLVLRYSARFINPRCDEPRQRLQDQPLCSAWLMLLLLLLLLPSSLPYHSG